MPQFEPEQIGQRIAQARKEAGLRNQDELADLLGVSMRMVQNYEAGVTIPYKHFRRLEEITGKPLTWFLRGDEEPTSAEAGAMAEVLDGVRALREQMSGIQDAVRGLEERLPHRQEQSASGEPG